MRIENSFTNSLHLILRDLIEQKSKRDQIKFTSSQLANALSMPRSMITKLTHSDQSKRVTNPRIDTLLKIVDFFKVDGFNITLDDLLGVKSKSIDVQAQNIPIQNVSRKIPLYNLESDVNKKLGTIDVKVSANTKNIMALYANEDIKPLFKKGSIFVIDTDMKPDDDTLIAIKLNNSSKIQIKKYHIEGNKQILKSYDPNETEIVLMPTMHCEIIGVIIQVNAKT